MALVRFARRLIWGKALFDLSRIRNDLPDATIRAYRESDMDACRDLYNENDQGNFPERYIERFEQNLADPNTLSLIMELDGRIIGTGGISIHEYSDQIEVAVLSYGLIHPSFQNQGYGTLLLVYRLSLLSCAKPIWLVSMTSAGNGTEVFFKKLGFKFLETREGPFGAPLDYYFLRLPKSDILKFRNRIEECGIHHFEDSIGDIPSTDLRAEYARQTAQQGSDGKPDTAS